MSAITILKAVSVATDLLAVANEVMATHGRLKAAIAKAEAEGRDHLTDAEWAEVTQLDDAARAKLAGAIASAKAQG